MICRALIVVSVMAVTLFSGVTAFAQTAPDFELPRLSKSSTLRLSDLKGKVVYLDFWASWCGPCVVSLPELEKLYTRYKNQGFEVVAINLDSAQEDAQRFLQGKSISYPVLFDHQQKTPEQYGVAGMPTAYLLDHTGKLRYTHTGFKPNDGEKLSNLIQQLLKEKES